MILRLVLTTTWALALAAFFRYWEITLRLGGVLFWTILFLALYVASAATLHGVILPDTNETTRAASHRL